MITKKEIYEKYNAIDANSTNIKNMGFYPPVASNGLPSQSVTDGTLMVEFHSGAIWTYKGISTDIYMFLLNSDSRGEYFSRSIKNNYEAEQLEVKGAIEYNAPKKKLEPLKTVPSFDMTNAKIIDREFDKWLEANDVSKENEHVIYLAELRKQFTLGYYSKTSLPDTNKAFEAGKSTK